MENTDIMATKRIFALNMRNLRDEKDMTQAEFAEFLNCTQQTINVWETVQTKGKVNFPTIGALIRISKKLNVTIDWLLNSHTNEPKTALSSAEARLLEKYNSLEEQEKGELLSYAEYLSQKSKDRKKDISA